MTDESTPLSALKARIAAFVAARDWAQFHAPKNLAMDIAVEAGELMEHYLWCDAPASFAVTDDPAKRALVEAEMADVAIGLLNLANVLKVDLAGAIERKMDEIEKKYPADKVRGKALKYSDY